MEEKEKTFLISECKKYYKMHEPLYPKVVEKREFGFGFDKKIDFRHKRFNTNKELGQYLATNGPLYVSYSVAYYTAPEARPMVNKNLEGSDLVFDIDVHDCKFHDENFVCDVCLERAKDMTVNLIEEFLVPDFGINKKDIWINFSGNRGYHVHVDDSKYLNMTSDMRAEMIDYLNGRGLDAGVFIRHNAIPESPAWFGRVARCILQRLKNGSIKTRKANAYISQIEKGIWSGVADSSWFYREFDKCIEKTKADVDEQVTTDVSRLIRLPNSVHGGSMLVAKIVEDLQRFDPLRDAVWESDEEIEISVSRAPQMRMKDRQFDEINNKNTRLPKYYAAYLIAKGAARLV